MHAASAGLQRRCRTNPGLHKRDTGKQEAEQGASCTVSPSPAGGRQEGGDGRGRQETGMTYGSKLTAWLEEERSVTVNNNSTTTKRPRDLKMPEQRPQQTQHDKTSDKNIKT